MEAEKFVVGISDTLADSWMCDINTESGEEVAYVIGSDKVQCESRAKQIAAAPEMLEALKHIVEYWSTPNNSGLTMNDHINHIMKSAEIAIKKATE